MDQHIQKKWVYILILAMICSSILAHDLSKKRTICSSTDQKRQSSSQQIQKHEGLCFSRPLSNRHNELASTESSTKTLEVLLGNPFLIKNILNITSTLANQNIQNVEDPSFEDGLLLSSATNGKERKTSSRLSDGTNSEDDDKKTLSQQVKEGKYGLIQNEIYSVKPKRPGIISYLSNSEVPQDTIKNLGGLDEEEIWLAENHVLVLKGGNFPELSTAVEQPAGGWLPIDNYIAPRRQVKIPAKPRVPPPFPVQLIDDGPVELIGSNDTNLFDNETAYFNAHSGNYTGFLPGEGPYFPIASTRNNSNEITSSLLGLPKKKTKAENVSISFYPALPPGAVIVSPPSNQTDYDDEDQSIYYPPPYSFLYSQDNSTNIPPGPLVPGIILPPPPDFFSPLNEIKSTTKEKYVKNLNTTLMPTLRVSYLSPRKSNTKLYKTPLATLTSNRDKTMSHNSKSFIRTTLKNSTFHNYQSEKTATRNYRTMPLIEFTTPISINSTTISSLEKYNMQQILGNQVVESSTEKTPWKTIINNKAVPLITFFATTTDISVEQTIETTPTAINTTLTTENPTRIPSQASYYFYDESNSKETHTPTSGPLVFFSTTSETPPYYKLEQSKEQQEQQQQQLQQHEQQQPQQQQKSKNEYYDVQMIPSQEITKDYNVKLIDSIRKDPHVYRYVDSDITSSQEKFEVPSIKQQSLRTLHSIPIYYQPLSTRSAPKLSYFTTQKPKTYYRKPQIIEHKPSSSKSKPIYQYSFEATNYEKSRAGTWTQKSSIPKQQQNSHIHQEKIHEYRRQKEVPLYNDYPYIQTINDQYDYENSEVMVEQPVQIQKSSYVRGKKNKQQSHYHRPTTATPLQITTLASHQQYFTKQDEQLLDDVTKEYFTVFGKKLSNNKLSTTPIYGKSSVTDKPIFSNVNDYESRQYNGRETKPFKASNIKVRYGDQTPGPFVGKDDILVNFKHSPQLPTFNPNSNFISLVNINQQSNTVTPKFRPQSVLKLRNQVREYVLSPAQNVPQRFDQTKNYGSDRLEQQLQTPQEDTANSFTPNDEQQEEIKETEYSSRPLSLESDILVNYKNSRPPINLDSEFIDRKIQGHVNSNTNKANSYFAYRLPGDGGHFYFLTPQAIRREDSTGGYLYSKPRSRLLEKRRR
ncbi:PREDICTED: uncharacterized protein LOC105363396 [Ceratosolen solmsi marchali]|uniref:Uncharacterized protein LOC105363396 n=1 Tax=Ceratosolen solmsi marchali TaxID=326594 RepID=A0AAJ6YJU4_9HYME|nr:PREDICTED: uncharacterized protein LOC105363396 [Ceratosolen solmsi marchali]